MLFRSNDTATTEIYTPVNTLSLHDALPISSGWSAAAAKHLPVFISLLHSGGCGRDAPHYRLLVERVWRSIPLPLTVCEYVPDRGRALT